MLHELDPLRDDRWPAFVERHPRSSLFHTRAWLEALRRSYGYEPVVYTDAAPSEALRNALVFCRVSSWITGRRLVSLPFSDHCEPLVEDAASGRVLLEALRSRIGQEGRYIEVRPLLTPPATDGYVPSAHFVHHHIDIRPSLDEIFGTFHRSHAQRGIRRAERLGVSCVVGRSKELVGDFYRLHAMTRGRHRMPVQPAIWFRSLVECFDAQASVYVARRGTTPIAALFTLDHKGTRVYKYGCSDVAFNRYAGTLALMWRAIQDARQNGQLQFDLGRSDADDAGLIAFKDHLGARRSSLTYYRYSRTSSAPGWTPRLSRGVGAMLPSPFRAFLGRAAYRHFG
ncbi:MAG TPA: GNAT family N-acetyltransferase [Vicinamibacterales bacterium]|nr:GNAT family N-acetyltransferase [Vicinamibacterales bacterium]